MTSSSSGSRVRPYLVTSADAARLPRWIPLLFCAVYVLAGLFGRDPWRTDDAIGFGIAHTMATGNSIDWLLPNVQGQLVPDEGGPLPFWAGAFFAGLMAAGAIGFLNRHTRLKPDVIIGLIFSTFFGLGLFMVSVSPTSVNIQTIVLGNILAVTPGDMLQLVIIGAVTLTVLLLKWKDLLVIFFDEAHARSVGLHPGPMKLIFFALLAACTVAAMQTVGAFLVIALIVTPGATAYLLSDRFGHVIIIATVIGAVSSFIGVYASYFLDGATGAVVVLVQAALFALAFLFAPTHGLLAARRRRRQAVSG